MVCGVPPRWNGEMSSLSQPTVTAAQSIQERYGGLDAFKVVAALLVICVHTSPLASFSADADFVLTRVIARIAVPFFMMVSGFFVLPRYVFDRSSDFQPLVRFTKKAALLYVVAIVVYLPINIYAGHFAGLDVFDVVRLLLFDGTFYHLWYLPAVVLGVVLVVLLGRAMPFPALVGACLLLYGIGLLGDSYFGAIQGVPGLASFYCSLFEVSSHTRNGLFYAPIFLVMGAYLRRAPRSLDARACAMGFTGSMMLMTAEGLVLHQLGWQRHDSMYLALLPAMFFLFQLVMTWDREPSPSLRDASTWIYLIHPLFIVAVRGFAALAGLDGVLVDNSLIHFLAVSALSAVFAVVASRLPALAPLNSAR